MIRYHCLQPMPRSSSVRRYPTTRPVDAAKFAKRHRPHNGHRPMRQSHIAATSSLAEKYHGPRASASKPWCRNRRIGPRLPRMARTQTRHIARDRDRFASILSHGSFGCCYSYLLLVFAIVAIVLHVSHSLSLDVAHPEWMTDKLSRSCGCSCQRQR